MSETREDRVLYLLARQAFKDEHARSVAKRVKAGVNWSRLIQVAQWHRVLPLVYRNLKTCGVSIPAEYVEEIEREIDAVRKRLQSRKADMDKLVADFLSDWPVMLVKGAALDVAVYPERALTNPCDIDLLVDHDPKAISAEEQARIDERLHSIRYIEMSCGEHHDLSMNDALDLDYARIFAESEEIEVNGRKFLIPSPEDMFMFSVINCCRKKFFHLKSLADLDAIMTRYPDLDWSRVEKIAMDIGADHILYAVLRVLKTVMGIAPHRMSTRPGFIRRSVINWLIRLRSFTSLRQLHRWPKRERSKWTRVASLLPYACMHRKQMTVHLGRDLRGHRG